MINSSSAIIERKRLFDLLAHDHVHRTLVLGRAGQGKSTLLASWLASFKPETLWIRINGYNRDQKLAAGLDIDCRRTSSSLKNALGTLKNPEGGLTRNEPGDSGDKWYRFIEEITSDRSEPLWIVIDDLHLLGTDPYRPDLLNGIIRAINDPPLGSRLLLAGRFVPDSIAKATKEAARPDLVIDNRRLAFDLQEIRLFFRKAASMSLAVSEAEQILSLTWGWPGGLKRVLELLGPVPAPERRRYIASGLESDLVQRLEPFFQQQVLAHLPAQTRETLLELSVYESLDRRLLVAAGWPESKTTVLDRLHAVNLFLDRRYIPDRGWSYVFHPLLRRYLHRHFHQIHGRRLFCRASLTAATTCQRINRSLDAVDNFFAANKPEEAAGIISHRGTDLVITGQFGRLRRWMQRLPAPLLEQNPWLQWLKAVCQQPASIGRVHTFDRLRSQFASLPDLRGQLLATASLLEAAVFVNFDRRKLAGWVSDGRRLLDQAADRRYYGWAKAWLWLQIGLAQIFTGLDLQQGMSACRNASFLASLIRNDHIRSIAESLTAMGLTLTGNLGKARRALEKADSLERRAGCEAYELLHEMIRLEFSLHLGNWPLAQKAKTVLEERIEDSGLLFLYPALLDAAARLNLYRGKTEEADKWRHHLADAATLAADPYYTAMAYRTGALVRYRNERFEQAAEFIRQALEILEHENLQILPYWQARLAAGLISLRRGRTEEALDHLEACGRFFDQAACISARAEKRLAMALVFKQAGQSRPAAEQLYSACKLLEESPSSHFTCLGPADLAELGRLAVTTGQKPTIKWGRRWLQLYGPSTTKAGPDGRREKHLPGCGRRQNTRQLLPKQLRIYTFGRFAVCNGLDQPIERRPLVTGRTAQLLKALIVLGVREVPREQLLETLWPEADPRAGNQTFKVTLHRLRKAMEPSLTRGNPSAYLHLSGKRLSLDRNLCWIDSEAFLKLDKDIRRGREALDQEHLLALCFRATALYQGPFLPEERYSSWTEVKRAALATAFVRIQLTMARILERRNDPEAAIECYRRILDHDPVSVDACQGLMRLYARLGRFGHLRNVYLDHCRALAEQIDEQPDPETKALYHRLSYGR